MFDCVDAVGQGFVCVAGMDWDGLGRERGAFVDALVEHEMDHHAGVVDFAAGEGCQRVVDGMGAGKLPGQRGVQVDDAIGKAAQKAAAEDVHPAGEHDPVGRVLVQERGKVGVVFGAAAARRRGRA